MGNRDSYMAKNLPDKICNKIVMVTIYAILLYALISCIICLTGVEYYGIVFGDEVTTFMSACVIFVILWQCPLPRISAKSIIISSFCVANAIMLTILLSFKTHAVSDPYAIMEMAKRMADGDFDVRTFDPTSYEYIYNWQIGMAWFESIFFRVFRPSFIMLQVINLLIINATLVLTYKLMTLVADKRSALATLALMSCFYPMLVTVGQLSNQNVVTPLILLAIIAVKKRKFVAAGVIIPLLSFIRPVGIILVIGLMCLFVYELISTRTNIKKWAIGLVSFLIPFVLCTWGIDEACMAAKYTDSPVSQAKVPYYKFHAGLRTDTLIMPFDDLKSMNGDFDMFNAKQRKEVTEAYVTHTLSTLKNNFDKMVMFLGWFDWRFQWTYNYGVPRFENPLITKCVAFGWGEYVVLIILCLIGYGAYRKRNGVDYVQILFIGLVLVYFFIEAWPGYRYEIYPLFFVFGGQGLLKLREKHVLKKRME